MSDETRIHLALGTDENYVDFALITLTSILAFHSGKPIQLHLMYEDLSEATLDRFRKFADQQSFEFEPMPLSALPGQTFYAPTATTV